MLEKWIARVCTELQQTGYIVDPHPQIPGVPARLYAHAPERVRLGFAKVETHLLFVDGDNPAFRRPDTIKALYSRFSVIANRGFRTPHGLRLQIPNLALVAVSLGEFPEAARTLAQNTQFDPWYGGEVGQLILVELEGQQVISLSSLKIGAHPRNGAFALAHASDLVRRVCQAAF